MLAFKSGRLLAPHPAYDLDGFFQLLDAHQGT
jgi:hypothetical protein